MAAPTPAPLTNFLGYYEAPNGTFLARNCTGDAVLANVTGADTFLYGGCLAPTQTADPSPAIITACANNMATFAAGSQSACNAGQGCAVTTIFKDGNNFTSAAITAFNCEPTANPNNVSAWQTIWPDRQFVNISGMIETQGAYGLPAWSNYHPEIGSRMGWMIIAIAFPLTLAALFGLGMFLLQNRRKAAMKFNGYDGGAKHLPGWSAKS